MDIGSFISGAIVGMAVEAVVVMYVWLWLEEKRDGLRGKGRRQGD